MKSIRAKEEEPMDRLGFLLGDWNLEYKVPKSRFSEAGNVLSGRFYKGFFVASHGHIYTKFDAIDSLALLHLNSVVVGDTDDKLSGMNYLMMSLRG